MVADALAYLRLAVHPDDDTAFLRIYNKPTRRIGAHILIEQDLLLVFMQLRLELIASMS